MKKTIKNEIDKLREFKDSSGLSDYKIAREIGVHPQSIRNWLTGRNKPSDLAWNVLKEFLAKQNKRKARRA